MFLQEMDYTGKFDKETGEVRSLSFSPGMRNGSLLFIVPEEFAENEDFIQFLFATYVEGFVDGYREAYG